MGEQTKIAWTDHTFNAWIGCQRVSPGCEHCYAEVSTPTRVARANGIELWGPKGSRRVTSDANWRLPLRWNRAAIADGVRRRVFCSSLSDVFEDRPELAAPRARLWELIASTRGLDWQLLTKRPENAERLWRAAQCAVRETDDPWGPTWLPNVWLGTTCEDQRRANERIPHLLAAPAAVRFLSVEPQIEAVDLLQVTAGGLAPEWPCHRVDVLRGGTWNLDPFGGPDGSSFTSHGNMRRVDWVIVGGESGHGARPFDVSWARKIVKQCEAAKVPCFVKQLGANVTWDGMSNPGEYWPEGTKTTSRIVPGWHVALKDPKGGDMAEWPEDLRVREFPKSAAE